MSSRQYITRAIVCGSKQSMTSDKSYLLFTQELGMLWAAARSVRMEKSKQRTALQDFSIIRISLVQGKSTWRIGSVEAFANPFLAADSRAARGGVAFVVKALRRYVHGEEMVPRTYIDAEASLDALAQMSEVEDVALYQQLFMLRMLDELGYIKNTQSIQSLIERETMQEALEAYDVSFDAVISKNIEHASTASHL